MIGKQISAYFDALHIKATKSIVRVHDMEDDVIDLVAGIDVQCDRALDIHVTDSRLINKSQHETITF